jgi:hypothetical protein
MIVAYPYDFCTKPMPTKILRAVIIEDPMHRCIGTYNNRVLVATKFFKWLYNPDEPDNKKGMTPPCMRGIRQPNSFVESGA